MAPRIGRARLAALAGAAVLVALLVWSVVDDDPPPAPASDRATKEPSASTPSTSAAPTAPSTSAPADCPMFPADSYWHAPVTGLAVDQHSASYVASIGSADQVKADFGAGLWEGGPIGIPVTETGPGTPDVPVSFDYPDESDPGPYPIPPDARIEGGPDSDGDRHVLVIDQGDCRLYELWNAHPNPDGSWRAGSGAVFDLRSHALRPAGWTSADAAGLPILPGLVRYEEVAAGRIDHAIRVTVPASQDRYLWPARHAASENGDPALPPMGLRLRLRADVDISGLAPQARVIADAMKTYGVIVADNGSAWYLGGVPDERWDNDALGTLDALTGADFEAVDASPLMTNPDSGTAAP